MQKLVPRFGRKVLQSGALTMIAGILLYVFVAGRYGTGIHSWQMIAPLVVMGLGMGLIVAPLTDAVLSEGAEGARRFGLGLISMTGQMGNALGLGLVSVVFFGTIDDEKLAKAPGEVGAAFTDAFQNSLGWAAGVLAVIFLVMFALPAKPKQHLEGGGDDEVVADETEKEPVLTH
ncbi:MFS transporter [Streptomyces tanashiensis]